MRLGEAEGSDDATIVGDSLGLGDGIALLCTDGLLEGLSLGTEGWKGSGRISRFVTWDSAWRGGRIKRYNN